MTKILNPILIYVGLAMLAVIMATSVKSCFDPPQVLTSIERIREIRDDSISYWKDQFNREHAEKRLAEGRLIELQAVYGPFMDSIIVALHAQGKDIKSIAAVGLSSTGTISAPVKVQYIDTSRRIYSFDYSDQWLNISGTISDRAYLKYSTSDSLIVATYQKRRGFLGLGKRETYINAYSLNPHSHIRGLTGLKVTEERAKRFGVGPYVGYGWNGREWAPSIGIGLQYSLIKF